MTNIEAKIHCIKTTKGDRFRQTAMEDLLPLFAGLEAFAFAAKLGDGTHGTLANMMVDEARKFVSLNEQAKDKLRSAKDSLATEEAKPLGTSSACWIRAAAESATEAAGLIARAEVHGETFVKLAYAMVQSF